MPLKRNSYRDDPVLLWITLCQFVIKLFFWQCLTTQTMCVIHNIEASLRNICCRGKATSITYSECMFVCSLSYLACKAHAQYYIAIYGLSGPTIFSTLSHKRCDFRKKNPWTYRRFTKYHTTNKCTNCMSFILNHFFKTLFTAPKCFDSRSLIIIREHI